MKFLQLRAAFERNESYAKKGYLSPSDSLVRLGIGSQSRPDPPPRKGPIERVLGGEILWKPVDKLAAKLLAKSPWICKPPANCRQESSPEPEQPTKHKRERKHHMSKLVNVSGVRAGLPGDQADANFIPGKQDYVSTAGLKVTMINNVPHFSLEELDRYILEKVKEASTLLSPAVKAAQDARQVMDELISHLGRDYEQFATNAKTYLIDIRQTRFAVISEISEMVAGLKDVRAFFIGPNHEAEMGRLKEFVGLCERLKALKDSGFLDLVADTMIRLSLQQPPTPS